MDDEVEDAGPAMVGEDRHGVAVLGSVAVVEADDDGAAGQRIAVPVVVRILQADDVVAVCGQVAHLRCEFPSWHPELREGGAGWRYRDGVVQQHRNRGGVGRHQWVRAAHTVILGVRDAEVDAGAAVQTVKRSAVAGLQRIPAGAATEAVLLTRACDEHVAALVAAKNVVAGAAAQDVTTSTPEYGVRPTSGANHITPRRSNQRVLPGRSEDRARGSRRGGIGRPEPRTRPPGNGRQTHAGPWCSQTETCRSRGDSIRRPEPGARTPGQPNRQANSDPH